MMRLRTLFSGIGAPESALKNLGIEYELVDFCEIDKYAVKSYCAIHGVDESKNLGDISKVWGRNLPYADMLIWGFPCTDISVAGKQAGIVEGETRSGLYYEGLRILKETMPKYSIIENVKNLVGKKFKAEFHQMLADIEELGYTNYWQVLNAKNYGIPQNRERVFIVSIRNDVDTGFEFPQGFDNGLRLKDFLEDEVDEKFYISQEKTEKLISQIKDKNQEISYCIKAEGTAVAIPCITPDREEKRQNGRRFKEDGEPMFTLTSQDRHGVLQVGMLDMKGNDISRRVYSKSGISPCVNARSESAKIVEPKPVRIGGLFDGEAKHQAGSVWDKEEICPTLDTMQGGYRQPSVIIEPNSDTRRGRVGKEVAQTLETSCNQAMIAKYKPISEIPPERFFRQAVETYNENEVNPSDTINAFNKSVDKSGYCPTLTTRPEGFKTAILPISNDYRIRKLTPKECFRLMGFSDEEFQRCVDAGVSNSQLYKQAGNSIVTNVLYYIFKNLLKEVKKC